MADGLYSGRGKSEKLQQLELTRHRLLTFNTDPAGSLNSCDASSYGSVDPNSPAIPLASQEGGPHFVLSPETPDGRPTLGFEFCLVQKGIPLGFNLAIPAAGGFDVTIWVMVGNTMLSDGSAVPAWASLAPETGVALNTLYHCFDVNATVLRFQIGNQTQFGSITVALAEL